MHDKKNKTRQIKLVISKWQNVFKFFYIYSQTTIRRDSENDRSFLLNILAYIFVDHSQEITYTVYPRNGKICKMM